MKKKSFIVFFLGFFIGMVLTLTVGYVKRNPRILSKIKQTVRSVRAQIGRQPEKDWDGVSGDIDKKEGAIWSGNNVVLSKSDKHCLKSPECLEARFSSGGYLSAWKTLPRDWSGFQLLSFDIYNAEDEVIPFMLLIKDEVDSSYPGRVDMDLALRPGENHFDINLTGLKSNSGKRQMALDRIQEVVLSFKKDALIYLDNVTFRSEKKQMEGSALLKDNDGMLSDFEDGGDLVSWAGRSVTTSIVNEHCSHGKKCLKAVYSPGQYPGLKSIGMPSDWSGFDTLKFDTFNPQDKPVKFGILIRDVDGGDAYPKRFDGYYALKTGQSTFQLNVTGLKSNDKSRDIAVDQIKEVVIFLVKPDEKTVIYFDNIRLESGEEDMAKDMFTFDFGPENSETWPGFTKVTNKTLYTEDTGYGWETLSGLRAEDRRYPDPLLRDWVSASKPFDVDVDNGKYIVYMMMEDPGFWEYYQNYPYREFYLEGVPVRREEMSADKFYREYYFRNQDHEDLPGEDVFEDYVEQRFAWRRFETDVSDGQLNVSCRSSSPYACTLSTLIIAPKEKEAESLAFMKELTEKRKQYFTSQYVEDVPAKGTLDVSVSDKDRENGFMLFVKDPSDDIYPSSVPEADELTEKLNVSVTPGEKRAFTVNVYPLKNLGECELQVSDLTADDGMVLDAADISVRTVQYKLKLKAPKIYSVKGEMLRNRRTQKIDQGITRQFWLTVAVPDTTAAGTYQGKVTFTTGAGTKQEIPLTVTVLPFSLPEAAIPMGLFYSKPVHFGWYGNARPSLWTAVERQLRDMREHGINTLALGVSPQITKVHEDGEVEMDFAFFQDFVRAYNHFGFDQTISGYGMISVLKSIRSFSHGDTVLFSKALKNAFGQISQYVRGFSPEGILIGLADEVSNTGGAGIESVLETARILKEEGSVRTTAYLNNPKDVEIFGKLDAVTINDGMKIDKELLDNIKKSGSNLWFYNIGQNRFSFGYYLWKTKAKGRVQWHYQLPAVDPYFDLDGRESDYCASYPSLEGPINAVWFERVREGIDDYRYIQTLDNLIKKAMKSSNTEVLAKAQEAQAVLDDIMKDVDVELKKNDLPVEWYDESRAKIAQEIVGLKEILDKKGQ